MLRVGLTGGIACGKSNALKCFCELGAYTIDADRIAREVVEPGKPAFEQIVRTFGKQILEAGEHIDRKALGRIIFADEAARQRLNAIVHPYVREEEEKRIAALEQGETPSRIAITDATLMIETGSYRKYQVIVVVWCPPHIQLRRLMRRDQLTSEEASLRIGSQMPILDKVKYGDYAIETSGARSDTRNKVKQVYGELLLRSQTKE
jgi:dephospho-CoA kinase